MFPQPPPSVLTPLMPRMLWHSGTAYQCPGCPGMLAVKQMWVSLELLITNVCFRFVVSLCSAFTMLFRWQEGHLTYCSSYQRLFSWGPGWTRSNFRRIRLIKAHMGVTVHLCTVVWFLHAGEVSKHLANEQNCVISARRWSE